VGILVPAERAESWEEATTALRAVVAQAASPDAEAARSGDALEELLDERTHLLARQRAIKDEISAVRALIAGGDGYHQEAREQVSRLQSIGLFVDPEDPATSHCPVCSAPLSGSVPTASAITASINAMQNQLASLTDNAPKIQRLLGDLEEQISIVRLRLTENRLALDSLAALEARTQAMRDDAARRAHVLGRISLYLESLEGVGRPDERSDLDAQVGRLRGSITALEDELGAEAVQERLDSISNILNMQMTRWASRLELEHSDNAIRLDLRKLAVVADAPWGAIPMAHMGSSENRVGYHVVTHLALHEWFSTRGRPVPHFLFLDQPAAGYFPADGRRADRMPETADDRMKAARMFRLIMDVVEELAPGLQVIITEHADLDEDWYQAAVRYNWWHGEKLIPPDWLQDGEGDALTPTT
jgi:hypothetical protein